MQLLGFITGQQVEAFLAEYSLELMGLFILLVYALGVWVFVHQRLRSQPSATPPQVVVVIHRHLHQFQAPGSAASGTPVPPVLHPDRN